MLRETFALGDVVAAFPLTLRPGHSVSPCQGPEEAPEFAESSQLGSLERRSFLEIDVQLIQLYIINDQ